MKTFFSDLFPKLQRYSQKLDNLTLLTNQHWVSVDGINNKTVYIFRSNNDLLVSVNGKVEKAKWEYIGNRSLLIDRSNGSYLFKHGFFDECVLALKVDGASEYAVFVNENHYNGELDSIEKVFAFLKKRYLGPMGTFYVDGPTSGQIGYSIFYEPVQKLVKHETDKGVVEIPPCAFFKGESAFVNGRPAPDGKYTMNDSSTFVVKDGIIVED